MADGDVEFQAVAMGSPLLNGHGIERFDGPLLLIFGEDLNGAHAEGFGGKEGVVHAAGDGEVGTEHEKHFCKNRDEAFARHWLCSDYLKPVDSQTRAGTTHVNSFSSLASLTSFLVELTNPILYVLSRFPLLFEAPTVPRSLKAVLKSLEDDWLIDDLRTPVGNLARGHDNRHPLT